MSAERVPDAGSRREPYGTHCSDYSGLLMQFGDAYRARWLFRGYLRPLDARYMDRSALLLARTVL